MTMKTLSVASCQFPVTENIGKNAQHIRRYFAQNAIEAYALSNS
jgi:hypothetical protein